MSKLSRLSLAAPDIGLANGKAVDDEPTQSLAPSPRSVSQAQLQSGSAKSVARLAKLKSLFPELASKLGHRTSIGPNEAVSLGGWTTKAAMNRDIASREKAEEAKKGKSKKT